MAVSASRNRVLSTARKNVKPENMGDGVREDVEAALEVPVMRETENQLYNKSVRT